MDNKAAFSLKKTSVWLLVFMLAISPYAAAETAPPSAPLPATAGKAEAPKAENIDKEKVKKAMAALQPLSAAEKKVVLGMLRRQMPKKSDADKLADRQETMARWRNMSAEDRAERRSRAAERWQTLTPEERVYQREQIVERLLALPADDRAAIVSKLATGATNGGKQ